MSDQTTTIPAKSQPEQETDRRPRRQPPHAVVLYNDDVNTFEFVVETLRKVFGYPLEKCFELTLRAHETGRSILWVGTLEHAELKADQIRSRGADPMMKSRGALPLKVSVDPQA